MLNSASFLNRPVEILVPSSKGYGELLYMKAGVLAYHSIYKTFQSELCKIINRARVQRERSLIEMAERP